MTFKSIAACLAILALGACAGFDEDTMSADRARCEAQGFASGSSAMARCMETASNERIARENREAGLYSQGGAQTKATQPHNTQHNQTGHSDKHHKNNQPSHKKQANTPTYKQTYGSDPGTANMTMCSDGKLREDCSYAPKGY